MTSSRRVALSLILVAACGGALVSFLPSARGQNVAAGQNVALDTGPASAPPTSGAAQTSSGDATSGATGTASTGTGPIPLKNVVGIAPVQIRPKPLLVEVIGGTGNESADNDLQLKNVYSLLQQRGVAIPNVLHPYSTAKPSFIVERLIVLSINGGNSTSTTGGASTSDGGRGGSGSGDTGGTTQAPAGPTAAQSTISDVHRFVDAELTRGSGRLGGAHRRKLRLLSDAIGKLETANSIGAAISSAVGGDGRGGGGGTSTGGGDKVDPREILYGQVRLTARAADRYVPAPTTYQ